MAPCEPLDDAETMRDGIKQWGKTRTQTGGMLALPGRWWEPACLLLTVLRADLYNENFYTIQSRLLVYQKRVTATHPRVEWSRASCPVASTNWASGRACRAARGGRSNPSVPGPTRSGTLHQRSTRSAPSPRTPRGLAGAPRPTTAIQTTPTTPISGRRKTSTFLPSSPLATMSPSSRHTFTTSVSGVPS